LIALQTHFLIWCTSRFSHFTEAVVLSKSDFAPVAYLRIKEANLSEPVTTIQNQPSPPVAPLLESDFEGLPSRIDSFPLSSPNQVIPGVAGERKEMEVSQIGMSMPSRTARRSSRDGEWVFISNVEVSVTSGESLERECEACWNTVTCKYSFAVRCTGLAQLSLLLQRVCTRKTSTYDTLRT
jgi:hypothetical protein